jgi:hypothetical protein
LCPNPFVRKCLPASGANAGLQPYLVPLAKDTRKSGSDLLL